MSDTPPPLQVEHQRKSRLSRVSIVWIIPVLAIVIALAVAWQTYSERGPVIEIRFENGAGIAERETELRYRDVAVGVVEEVRFSEDLASVVAAVRVDKDVAAFIDVSASFWIVRPEVTARGITGLDTVLSGVYIEGTWDSKPGTPQTSFDGLTDAPLFRPGGNGLEIVMRTTPDGTMTDDSPITFRGIEVGRVGKASISPQGNYAVAEALIYEQHTGLISSRTRFWETSGFTFSVGPQGAEIDFSSIATLVSGGLTFDTFVSGGEPVDNGTVFEVYATEEEARNSLFQAADVETLEARVVFDENVSGLAVDAPVEINGLKIGEVQSVLGVIDEEEFGDSRVRLSVVLAIQPARLGLQDDVTPETAREFLADRVAGGLRARLTNASILTGGLKIDLVQVDDAEPQTLETPEDALPIIPTTESDIVDAAATVEGVVNRINNLPIEELLGSAIDFLDSAQALVANEDLQETPGEVRAILSEIRTIVASEDVQNIPVALNASVTRLESLLAEIEETELASRLVNAVDAAADAAEGVTTSVEGIPALVEQIEAVAAKAEALPVEDLANQLTELAAAAEGILDTEAARQLPADLSAALNEINATLTELREGGAVTNLNATLGSARRAADAVATSTEDLPALVERLGNVLNQASVTIAGYNKGDTLSREAQSALRDISQAADALTSLARMLERNPSALIRGR
ncbi:MULTISPECIES: intermembrane transport protein PqiB [unclassified Roseovarius]|uniref:PqiB family protein n=1 Tax=unclassified Roseovarius TaxID=2614913 RepID=UPI00273DF375|nr:MULTISPECIES: MlaD family protein [unclassified Roseovarius]